MESYPPFELTTPEVIWRPQPGPQTILMQLPYEEIFFGGARGGGKTSGLLGHWLAHANRWKQYARGILFRKTFDEFEEVHEQAKLLYYRVGAKYNTSRHVWLFPNKASLRYRFLEKDKDADKYQGRSYTWQGWEELTNWQSAAPIDKVSATLRSADGVKCQWIGTGNPGGPGHNWVKARFIIPAPPFVPHFDPVKQLYRVFIPSKLSDNRILMDSDPLYAARLRGAGPDWLVDAWLDGNWNIIAGGMFDDLWNASVHILQPFDIPKTWRVERTFDWGSSRPFSLGWWAISNGDPVRLPNDEQLHYYKGTRIRIGEWYGWDGKTPNKGLDLVDTEVARRGRELEKAMEKTLGIRIAPGPADPAIFAVVNGRSIGHSMGAIGLQFVPATTGPNSRVTGWNAVRRMLKAALKYPMMEEAGMFVFSTCQQFIRTVPILPRDKKYLDDVDTESEDHIGDETRYGTTQVERTVSMVKMPV